MISAWTQIIWPSIWQLMALLKGSYVDVGLEGRICELTPNGQLLDCSITV